VFRLLSIELNEGLGCGDFDIFSGSAQILHGIAAYVVDNECVIWILFTVRLGLRRQLQLCHSHD